MGKYSSKNKLYLNRPKDLYITGSQAVFLKNIMFSESPYSLKDYTSYIHKCVLYNKISDIYDEDGDACTFFWDEDDSSLIFTYPKDGKVSDALGSLSSLY
jgi:hypothetical protein